jgi:hypothetical protein
LVTLVIIIKNLTLLLKTNDIFGPYLLLLLLQVLKPLGCWNDAFDGGTVPLGRPSCLLVLRECFGPAAVASAPLLLGSGLQPCWQPHHQLSTKELIPVSKWYAASSVPPMNLMGQSKAFLFMRFIDAIINVA